MLAVEVASESESIANVDSDFLEKGENCRLREGMVDIGYVRSRG